MRFDRLLHFHPLYQTRVWGGRHLETLLGRELPDDRPYGESWELVDRADHQSVIAGGRLAGVTLHELWTAHRAEVFGCGGRQPDAARFPLLIKILDCREDLSIQVHPPADVARELGGEPKTEMWFVAAADAGAVIHAGLRRGTSRQAFERALDTGSLDDVVHRLHPAVGDTLLVPSGRVHALGAGLVVFEIQQNSDTTYRVFDWNRVGLDGRPRALHVDASMRSIDFDDFEPEITRHSRGELASSPFFRVTRAATGDPAPGGQGRLILPVGITSWAGETLRPGQLTLCPVTLDLPGPDGEWLEIEY
jgi:mannose-6-phosphate isomerase